MFKRNKRRCSSNVLKSKQRASWHYSIDGGASDFYLFLVWPIPIRQLLLRSLPNGIHNSKAFTCLCLFVVTRRMDVIYSFVLFRVRMWFSTSMTSRTENSFLSAHRWTRMCRSTDWRYLVITWPWMSLIVVRRIVCMSSIWTPWIRRAMNRMHGISSLNINLRKKKNTASNGLWIGSFPIKSKYRSSQSTFIPIILTRSDHWWFLYTVDRTATSSVSRSELDERLIFESVRHSSGLLCWCRRLRFLGLRCADCQLSRFHRLRTR